MNFIKAAAIAISAVIACGAAEAKMPKEVNIVYVKAPFNLQNMVIKDQKLLEKAFAKDGVKVNWKTITSGAQQSQAMAAGSVDVSAVMNTASLLLANGAGNPVQIATGVAHPAENFAIVVKSGSIKSIKDLKGKRVAGPRGTVLQQLLARRAREERDEGDRRPVHLHGDPGVARRGNIRPRGRGAARRERRGEGGRVRLPGADDRERSCRREPRDDRP